MPKLNTSVLIGDKIYPRDSEISKELAKEVDDKSVFDDSDVDAADFPEGEPSTDWTGAQLDAYADSKSFDISAAKNKQEKVDSITAAAAASGN